MSDNDIQIGRILADAFVPDPFADRRHQAEARSRAEALAERAMLNYCADALRSISAAIHYPRVAALHIGDAMAELQKALSAAKLANPSEYYDDHHGDEYKAENAETRERIAQACRKEPPL